MNHKFWNAGTGKPEDVVHAVKNAETVEIPAGTPVVYAMNGTDDGLAVVLPASSNATKISTFAAGVTVKVIAPGKLGDVQVYGFNRSARVFRGSRAASTAGWPSFAAFAIGDILQIGSAENGFVSSGAGAASAFQPFAVVAEAVASQAATVSSANGSNNASALSYYQTVKTFLRFM